MRDYPASSLVIDSVTNGRSDSGIKPELSIIKALYYPQFQQTAGDPKRDQTHFNPEKETGGSDAAST